MRWNPSVTLDRRWVIGPLLALVLLTLCAPGELRSQEIWAKVVDATNNRPIPDAEVQVLYSWGEVMRSGLTDRDGRVHLRVPPGGYRIAVDRLGYPAIDTLGVHLAPGQNLTVQLKLQPEAIELEGLSVIVEEIDWHLEMSGFYNRQRGASGFFKEISESEGRTASRASDYFRGARGIEVRGGVPLVTRAQQLGFWVFEDRGLITQSQSGFDPIRGRDDEERNTANAFSLDQAGPTCPGLLVLDGLLAGSTAELNVKVNPRDIAAIEVHPHASSAPPQWRADLGGRGSAACGVFVVWTKRGQFGGE